MARVALPWGITDSIGRSAYKGSITHDGISKLYFISRDEPDRLAQTMIADKVQPIPGTQVKPVVIDDFIDVYSFDVESLALTQIGKSEGVWQHTPSNAFLIESENGRRCRGHPDQVNGVNGIGTNITSFPAERSYRNQEAKDDPDDPIANWNCHSHGVAQVSEHVGNLVFFSGNLYMVTHSTPWPNFDEPRADCVPN